MIRIVRKFAILFAVLTAQLYTAAAYYAWSLPDSYYTADSSTLELDTALHIAAVPAEHTVQAAADTAPASERISLRLFGLIPVKEVEVQQIETPLLVPCGQPFGIKLRMDGALVVGMSDVKPQRFPLSGTGGGHPDRRPHPVRQPPVRHHQSGASGGDLRLQGQRRHHYVLQRGGHLHLHPDTGVRRKGRLL